MSPVIRFSQVTKAFSVDYSRSESIQDFVTGLIRDRSTDEGGHRRFTALQDLTFEIQQGDTVGIVGDNGAGKSTLLKLISRIIEPTKGEVQVNGRVRALLELGTGFHPDLTGRENIALSASLMGVDRAALARRVDDIISFAQLDRFIDMPVRHYSSGMYMRLGFSVAVYTYPEILVVDEVLAVGDAAFQRKCLERIDLLRRDGVTVVFVSHNADTVRSLCTRAIWLEGGRMVADGAAELVVSRYLDDVWRRIEGDTESGLLSEHRWGSGLVQITGVRLLDEAGQEHKHFVAGQPLVIEIAYNARVHVAAPVFGLAIHRSDGIHVTGPNTGHAGYAIPAIEGQGVVLYRVDPLPLLSGTYYLSVAVHNCDDTEMYDYHDRLYPFRVGVAPDSEQYGLLSLNGVWSWTGT